MNKLYLIRHGENVANITKEFSHKKVDYSLTEKGILQACQTADFIYNSGLNIDEIYSSPLKRANETAQIIAVKLNKNVHIIEELREVNVGSLEGMDPSLENWKIYNDTVAAWLNGNHEISFPDGENYHSLSKRFINAITQILQGKSDKNIALVAHAGIFTYTLKSICDNIDPMEIHNASNNNCSITIIEAVLINNTLNGKLINWADSSHIAGVAAKFSDVILESK